MKEVRQISSTANPATGTVGLDFHADTLIIQNPTALSLAVRVGSQSPPVSLASADIICPAVTMLALPVTGREFAFAFLAPSLAAQPVGMPTQAIITLTAHEPAPVFGSVPLAGAAQPVATLVKTVNAVAAGGHVYANLPVPSGTRYLRLEHNLLSALDNFTIMGDQSSLTYLYFANDTAVPATQRGSLVVEFDDRDSSITLLVGNANPMTFYLYALSAGDRGAWLLTGKQRVDVMPDGFTQFPIIPYIGGVAVQVGNPLPAQLSQGNAAVAATNPLPVQLSQGLASISAANPVPVQLSVGNAAVAAGNPLPVRPAPFAAVTIAPGAVYTGAGNHIFGPFSPGYQGGVFVLRLTAGIGVGLTLGVTEPQQVFYLTPITTLALGNHALAIERGGSSGGLTGGGAGAGLVRYAAGLPDKFYVVAAHGDANPLTYSITFYPTG